MQIFQIQDSSQIADARRDILSLAGRIGFSEAERGRVGIVATELATNLIKHGGGGALMVDTTMTNTGNMLECISADSGRGMNNIAACLEDGYSTAGSPGTGLGAILRQANFVDIYSRPGGGTVVLTRLLPGLAPVLRDGNVYPLFNPDVQETSWGAVCIAKPGEEVSGDSWQVRQRDDGLIMLAVDGLGHGTSAAEAARAALQLFDKSYERPPVEILERMHAGMRHTRGAAVAIALLDHASQTLHVAGIGNIAGTLATKEGSRRLISHNGTVGHSMRKAQQTSYPYRSQPTVILTSDGLSTSWTMDRYPGLLDHHPSTIAAVLYWDLKRSTDDATALVARLI